MELRAPCPINNVASVRVLAPSTLPWGRGGVLAFIFSMFMFLDKRSCVNQTASFCRAGFWVWTSQFGAAARVLRGLCLQSLHPPERLSLILEPHTAA